MFDIGFWELVAITIVALLVLGPERLPKFARDLGRFTGKIKRFIQSTRQELEQELNIVDTSSLHKDIDHLDKLLQEAPDRIISGSDKNTQQTKSD